MSTTSISPSAAPNSKALSGSRGSLLLRPLEYWHLLSLDAPTVAVVWAWAFGKTAGVSLHPVSLLPLGLATWLVYVIDRLLDCARSSHPQRLQERHRFHARHRTAFVATALPASILLLWMVVARMAPGPRLADLTLSCAAGIYLFCVHLPLPRAWKERLSFPRYSWPKEPAVAIIFASACVIPTWSRQPLARPSLMLLGTLFAALCYLNCVAIERWESQEVPSALHPLRIAMGIHLREICIAVALLSAGCALMFFAAHRESHAALALSVAVSACLLLLLDRIQQRAEPLRLRAVADAVLLTPPIFFLALHLGFSR